MKKHVKASLDAVEKDIEPKFKKKKSSQNIICYLGVGHNYVDKFLPKDFQIEKSISGRINKKLPNTSTKEQDKEDGLFDL